MSDVATHTVLLAGSDETAEALGAVFARVGLLALGVWLLVAGLRQRGRTQGRQGTAKVVIGSVVLAFVILGTLGSVAQQA